jgi:hypothetical protein
MSDYRIEAATKEEWAERALRAEADLRKMALDYLAAEGQAAEAYQAQLATEAKLEEAIDALHWCAIVHGSIRARKTLAKLQGETDE